jgi:chromosome segregation ATPase
VTPDSRLALLRELVAADEACSAELAELDAIAAELSDVRSRAETAASVLSSAEGERARLAQELAEAENERGERARAVREAAAALAAAEASGDEERLAAARRFHVWVTDALHVTERRVGAVAAAQQVLEEQVSAAEEDAPAAERRAAAISASLSGRPRIAEKATHVPRTGLDGVMDWATTARAALVVARTAVVRERDNVIRQANELGSAVLGEPLLAASASVVAAHVEQHLTS